MENKTISWVKGALHPLKTISVMCSLWICLLFLQWQPQYFSVEKSEVETEFSALDFNVNAFVHKVYHHTSIAAAPKISESLCNAVPLELFDETGIKADEESKTQQLSGTLSNYAYGAVLFLQINLINGLPDISGSTHAIPLFILYHAWKSFIL